MICDTSLLWNRKNIARHLRIVHRMPAQQYAFKYKHKILTQIQDIKQSKKSKAGKGAAESVSRENAVIRPAAENKAWYLQQGGYRCPLCHSLLSSLGNLKQHIHRVHQLTPAAFAAEHGELLDEPVGEFVCKICDAVFPWTPRRIKRHLESIHFLSLEKYSEIYLRQTPSPSKAVTGAATSAAKSIPWMKPVKVSVEKLRCDLMDTRFTDSSLLSVATTNPTEDYASMSKNEQGRCLNSAIENIFMDWVSSPETGSAVWRHDSRLQELDERLAASSGSEQLSPHDRLADGQSARRRNTGTSNVLSESKRCPSCLYTTYKRTNLSR
jgi:hypothetical protein